jgi:hypothetical protein
MDVNEQIRKSLEQAKKLTDDANAIKTKSLADAQATVAMAKAIATIPATKPPTSPPLPPPKKKEPSNGKYIYSVFHTTMSLVAIFLSYRCNGCFEWIPFLVALCCPYAYIIYIIAFKGACLSTSFIAPQCAPEVVFIQGPQYGYQPPSSYPPPSFGYPPPAPMPPTMGAPTSF